MFSLCTVHSNMLINCFGVLHCNICRTVLRNCFLSGTSDLQKCISCGEKYYKISPCTQNHGKNKYMYIYYLFIFFLFMVGENKISLFTYKLDINFIYLIL